MDNNLIQALDEKNFEQILTKISVEEAEERFEVSYGIMNLEFDEDSEIADPAFYFYEGDLHVSSLSMGALSDIAKFNLIVDGNLYVDGNIVLNSKQDMGFVIVKGNVTAKNVIVSGCVEFNITGSLTVEKVILGHSGHKGILGVDEAIGASIIINVSNYTMYFYDEINAVVLGDPIYTSNEVDYEDKEAAKVLLSEFVDKDGMPNVPAIIKAIDEDRNIVQEGIGSTHVSDDESIPKSHGINIKDIITEAQSLMGKREYVKAYSLYKDNIAAVKLDKEDYDSMYYYYGFLFAIINRVEGAKGDEKVEFMKEYVEFGSILLEANSGPILFHYSDMSKFRREVKRNASNGVGWYLMELGKLEEALPYAETAVSLIESAADDYTYETLALILIKLGRKNEGYSLVKRTLDKKPKYEHFQIFLKDEDYLAWKEETFIDESVESKDIKEVVERFNKHIMNLDGSTDLEDCCSPPHEFKKIATEKEIEQLKEAFEIPMPADLVDFYATYGCIAPLESYYCEDHYLIIFSAQAMLKSINESEGGRCKSFGIVDMIVDHWGQDRYEFTDDLGEEETEMFKNINSKFKCIGEYALDWGLEESYYIFFDENGKYGAVRYHQDEYNELIEQFESLLEGNGPTLSLKEVIEKGFEEIKGVIEVA